MKPEVLLRAAAAICGAAVAVAMGSAATSDGALIYLVASIAAGAIWYFPAATVLVPLIVGQEIDPTVQFTNAGGWFYFGHELYYGFRFPALVIVTVIAAVVATIRFRPRLQHVALWTAAPLIAMLLWAVVFSVAEGAAPFFAINSLARPFVAGLAAFVVGLCLVSDRRGRQVASLGISLGLIGWAAWGALKAAQGQGAEINQGVESGTSLIFYDAAMPMIAGAVALGLVFARGSLRLREWVLLAACLVVVLLSLRRNVWLALTIALVVGVFVARRRSKVGARAAVIAGVGGVGALLVSPAFIALLGARLESILLTVQGRPDDGSAVGHVLDIELGWAAIQKSPLLGLGPEAGPLPGLVVSSSKRLYVHNEYLQTWLLFGLPGLLLLLAFIGVCLLVAVRVLRARADLGPIPLGAAFFLLGLPVALNAAPYLTGQSRWMLATGAAAGICAAALGGQSLRGESSQVAGREPSARIRDPHGASSLGL